MEIICRCSWCLAKVADARTRSSGLVWGPSIQKRAARNGRRSRLEDQILHAYLGADYAGFLDTHSSISGSVLKLSGNQCVVVDRPCKVLDTHTDDLVVVPFREKISPVLPASPLK